MDRIIKMKSFAKIIIAFILIISSVTSSMATKVNGKIISDSTGIKIIKVWGTHKERGFATGYLLAENIRDIYMGYILPFLGKYLGAVKDHVRFEKVIKIDKIFHTEAQSMIAGMKEAGVDIKNLDEYDILLANAFLDLLGITSFHELRELSKKMGCSSLISWGDATKNTDLIGKAVITRHLDWPNYESVINNQVIIIHSPSEPNEQKWMMIGFAGQISVLSGINHSGLGVFLHMLSDYNEPDIPLPEKPFEPLSFTLRRALETKDFNKDGVNNLEDIKEMINSNAQGYAEGFIVSMVGPTQKESKNTAAIFELAPTPPHIVLRDVTYEDNLNGSNLYTANSAIKRLNKRNYCKRYLDVSKEVGNGKLMSSERCWQIMKNYSTLSNNIQFMQYIPELNILKISVYKNGKAAYTYKPHTYDLKELFK